jgi:hypothetical protein
MEQGPSSGAVTQTANKIHDFMEPEGSLARYILAYLIL